MRWLLILVGLCIASIADAQSIGGNSGISNVKASGSGGAPLTPCNAGAIDLSLASGCNLIFFVGEIFP